MSIARSQALMIGKPGTTGTGSTLIYTCPAGTTALVKWLRWSQDGGSGGAIQWYHQRTAGNHAHWTGSIAVANGAAGASGLQVFGVLEAGQELYAILSSIARGFWNIGVYGSELQA